MYKGADRVYHSLLDVELEDFGLPNRGLERRKTWNL